MGSTISRSSGILVWIGAMALLLLFAAIRWPDGAWMATGFDSLLPADEQDPWRQEANRAVSADFADKLVVLVRGEDPVEVETFQGNLATKLVESGYAAGDFESDQVRRWGVLAEALHPFRMNLVSAEDRAALERDPARFLADYRRLLYSPLGGPLLNTLPSDPMGLFRDYLQSAAPQFLDPARPTGRTSAAMDIRVYRILPDRLGFRALAGLWKEYLHLRNDARARGLDVVATGAPLYSAYGVFSGQREISSVGLASLALLIGLLFLVLRSPSAILLVLVCIAVGVSWGLLATVAVLGEIHVLTLVFGVTLIGISADYAFHFLTHSLTPDWRRETALDRVWRSLSLGLVSSVLAFALLTFLPFPGLRQIGLFMAAGLLGSYLTVCLLLPAVYRGAAPRAHLPRWAFRRRLKTITGRWLLLIAVVCAAPGLWGLSAQDDVRDFYAAPQSLREADRAIADVTKREAGGRYFLLRAEDAQSLLALEERLLALGGSGDESGRTGGLIGMTRLVPSAATQRKNFDLVRHLVAGGYLAEHLGKLGLAAEEQEAILSDWRAGTEEAAFRVIDPLRISRLELPEGTGGLLGCDESGCAARVGTVGTWSDPELHDLANATPGVALVDPVGDINALMERSRSAVTWLLLAGVLAASLFLVVVAGCLRALNIVSLPLLACLLTFAVIGYAGGVYSIVHILALMLVIGVSLDFAIFRSFTPTGHQPATTLAIALSAMTSVLAFGMLAFSRTPIIADFGFTIAIGLSIAWALSWFTFSHESRSRDVD